MTDKNSKQDICSIVSKCNSKTINDKIKQLENLNEAEKSCKWERKTSIGSGTSGEAFSVCCNENCNYIVKVIKFTGKNTKETFINEVKLQHEFYNKGFAPRILVACSCSHEGVILMEKVTLLGEYLENNKLINKDKIKKMYTDKYREVLKSGLVHNDTNPGNIAISLDGKPLMIDFGLSLKKELTPSSIKAEVDELGMSLDLVFKGKNATDHETKRKVAKSRIHAKKPKTKGGLFQSSDDDDDDDDEESSPKRLHIYDDDDYEEKQITPKRLNTYDDMSDDEEQITPKRLQTYDDDDYEEKQITPKRLQTYDDEEEHKELSSDDDDIYERFSSSDDDDEILKRKKITPRTLKF
jgi:hypothetical protein